MNEKRAKIRMIAWIVIIILALIVGIMQLSVMANYIY